MSQKTYMYDTQWQALINAINGGDTSAIATALGQIKTSVDSITTALESLSTDVTQDATQWSDLITAIGSGGGGGGGTIDIDATQWTSLVNAITNQSLTVDLSNVTSSIVTNLSNVTGATLTDALNSSLNVIDISSTVSISNLVNLSSVSVTACYKWGRMIYLWLSPAGNISVAPGNNASMKVSFSNSNNLPIGTQISSGFVGGYILGTRLDPDGTLIIRNTTSSNISLTPWIIFNYISAA